MKFKKVIPILLILAAPAGMLYPLWSHPTSAGEDDLIFYYPLRKMVGQSLAQGQWPVNNPLEATGGPLLSDPQAAGLHPMTWLFAYVPPKLAYSLSIFAAFSLAGLGALLYLRRLRLAEVACTFGAMVFMFSGFMVGHRVHLSMIQTAGMLPWILLAIELTRSKGNDESKPALAFSVMVPALFLAIAAGSWPTLIQMGIVCVAYFLLRARPLGRALAVCVPAAALAAVLAGPQIVATAQLLGEATRQKIGYSTAGENSFFPSAGVLAFFPMLMGTRWPNFYPQTWWGPWHLCEMLGYVGLGTLALAGSAAWRLYRKTPKSSPTAIDGRDAGHVNLVRVWTWLALGAGIVMLGYYIPPLFWLIHKVPILGVVRCPARMVLAVDMALATLSAVAIHYVISSDAQALSPAADFAASFRKSVQRFLLIVLPAATLAALGVTAAVAYGIDSAVFWMFYTGRQPDAKAALYLANPAIWVPLAMLIVTLATAWLWLRRPARLAPLMVCLALLDLLFIARFVDMPAANINQQDPDTSPAAAWLHASAPAGQPYRVLSISEGYFGRASELLRPKACNAMGIASINSYGPFQNPRHAQLLSLSIFGTSRDWAGLLRRNYLLSLYGVRYIVTADPVVRGVLESVKIPTQPSAPDGPNLLTHTFEMSNATSANGTLVFKTSAMWRPSAAAQPVELQPGTVYRISLDARASEGAADILRVEAHDVFKDGRSYDRTGLAIRPEEIGPEWRHFEWTFITPTDCSGERKFQVSSISERPIEVKDISLRTSQLDVPLSPKGKLGPGQNVYALRAELPAINSADTPVTIYENLLCGTEPQRGPASSGEIERLKWNFDPDQTPAAVPDVSLTLQTNYSRLLRTCTIPAASLYIALIIFFVVKSRRRPLVQA